MGWRLHVWFGYSDCAVPAVVENFDTKLEAKNRGLEILSDGYLVDKSRYHFYPASAVTHIELFEYEPPIEE